VEKKNMLQVLIPGLAVAAVVGLIALLILSSDWNAGGANKGDPSKAKVAPAPAGGFGKKGEVESKDFNDDGMVDAVPKIDGPEWVSLDGGLKYWDVKEGTGEACAPSANVVIHYTGWRLDGFKFDSSRKGVGARPADFPLDNLVKGWQLGIPGMKPGGIRRLLIPPALGYGAGGSPPNIPGNATLVFEIKLLSFTS